VRETYDLQEPSCPSCASLWPFLALPAADDGPRGIGELLRGEAGVGDAFRGSDGMQAADLTSTAALTSPFPYTRARTYVMEGVESMEVARATRPRDPMFFSADDRRNLLHTRASRLMTWAHLPKNGRNTP
jgi:hypothetical protein